MASSQINLRNMRRAIDAQRILYRLAFIVLILLLALALALLPLTYAGLLVAASIVLVLVLVDPVWALYLAVLSVPVQEIILLPGGLSVTQATVLLGAGSWGLRILANPERAIVFGRLAPGLAALLWALLLATVTTPYSQVEGFKEVLRWSMAALVYLMAFNFLRVETRSQSSLNWRAFGLVVCLLVAPTINGVFGIWQFATASGPPSFEIADGRFVRAYGTIGQPNSFAGSLNMAWPLAVGICLFWILDMRFWMNKRQSNIQKLRSIMIVFGAGVCAIVLLTALGATFSRGGWVGALGGAVALAATTVVLLSPPLRRRAWQFLGLGVGGITLIVLMGGGGVLPNPVEERLVSIVRSLRLFDVRGVQVTPENFAVVERMAHLQAGWGMFIQHPISGVGPGNYTLAYEGQGASEPVQPYSIHPWYLSRGHAHNYYLNIAAEAGVIGLGAYLLLTGLLLAQAWATLKSMQSRFWRGVTVGSCGIIVAVLTHNFFEHLHVLNMPIHLSAAWGLLAALEPVPAEPGSAPS